MASLSYFDPVDHSYWHAGRRLVSVTEVLKRAGRINMRWYTPEAASRGTRTHAASVAIDHHDGRAPGRPPAIPPAIVAADDIGGCVEAYVKFVTECRPVYRTIERACFKPAYGLGGRPDRTLRSLLGYRGGVLELKTGAKQPWHALQLAGYVLIDPVGGPRWVCYLQDNGRYVLDMITDPGSHAEFAHDLSTVRQAASTWLNAEYFRRFDRLSYW